jgi:hypothetical protein
MPRSQPLRDSVSTLLICLVIFRYGAHVVLAFIPLEHGLAVSEMDMHCRRCGNACPLHSRRSYHVARHLQIASLRHSSADIWTAQDNPQQPGWGLGAAPVAFTITARQCH